MVGTMLDGNGEIGAGVPLYLRIAQELRTNIRDGAYRSGERIPTEDVLARRFNVNRHTLRRAVGLLATEGLLRVDQGRGTFVSDAAVQLPIGARVRYNESLRAQGIEPRYQILRQTEVPASERLANKLQVPLSSPVLMLERLGLANDQPLKIATSYFPVLHFPDITQQMEEYTSISRLFREVYGCDHRRLRTVVTASRATNEEARLFGVAYNTPVLVAEAFNADQEGRLIEYGVTRFRSDRTELVIEPPQADAK
jgi:GntR family transcriptional regulator, phosphonate transport system regulatory protein